MNILEIVEKIIGTISNTVWPIFLPCILVLGAFLAIRTFTKIQPQDSEKSKVKFANLIGPASISLGAMIGTGAIIGVLGSLSNLVSKGQVHIEAMAIWALIGAVIMVPVSYSETLCSKVMGKTPKEYIGMLLSPKLAVVYAIGFCALYVFGFGGFQFSGMDSVVTIVTDEYLSISLNQTQRYLFIVLPIIIIVAVIVLTKKHDLFINAMTYMIGTAVVAYFIFFTLFIIKTHEHIPVYLSGMIEGMTNPVNAMLGVPLGFILGMQRVIQTAETGLGALAMSAQESDSEPREAAMISLIPTIVTIFVSIVVTTYIASYGVTKGIIEFPSDSVTRLKEFFMTASDVTGVFGLIVLCLFTLLSGLTTLLGSYYFLTVLFNNKENTNIAIYLALIFTAGTLAVFGFNIVFDAVDLLLFVVGGINVTALAVFAVKKWKEYKL